jgi:hypothetical protein
MQELRDLSFLPIGKKTELSSRAIASSTLLRNLLVSGGHKSVFSFGKGGYIKSADSILTDLFEQGAILSAQDHQSESITYLLSWRDRPNCFLDLYINSLDSDENMSMSNLLETIKIFLIL